VEVQPAQQAVRFARGKSFIQAPAHRLARQARMLGERQRRAGQQLRVRRAPPLGVFEQLVAIRRASCLPESLLAGELAPRTAARLLAQGCFQFTLDEAALGPAPPTLSAQRRVPSLSPGVGGQQDLPSLSLYAACLPPLSIARDCVRARLAQL
jgi:hypothetical protein